MAETVRLPRPLPHQRRLLASGASRQLLIAGVGSGKTHTLVYWVLRRATLQPGLPGAIFAPSFRLFTRVVLPTWRELIPPAMYSWHPGDQVLELANGTRIVCLGTDRAVERVVGLNLAWAAMDEAGVARDDIVPRLIMQRIRVGRSNLRALALFTSPHGYGWLRDWSQQTGSDGSQIVDVVRATTYDNPYLPESYLRDLEVDFPPGTLLHRQEMLGEFVVATGLVYGEVFDRSQHIADVTYQPDLPYVVGWDPGSRASGIVALQRWAGAWVVIREWTPDGEQTDDTARRILREMGRAPREVWMDTPSRLSTRTGITDVQAIRHVMGGACQVRVLAGRIRETTYRHRAVLGALARGDLLVSRSLLARRERGGGRGLIRALESLAWADASPSLERVEARDPLKHIIDALEFAVSKLIPPRYDDPEARRSAARRAS